MIDSKRSFVVLDGLRGIAALSIVVYHVSYAKYFFTWLPKEAFLSVDFFFTLSGFVLAHAYGERLRKGMSAGHFMRIRLIRLYPLYLLAFILYLPLAWRALWSGSIESSTLTIFLLSAILFLPCPLPGFLYPLNSPAWSLFFELIANAAFGLFGRRLTDTVLPIAVAVAAVILIGHAVATGTFEGGFYWSSFGAGLCRVAYSFFAGVLVYQIWLRRKPPIAVPALVVGAVLLAILIMPIGRFEVVFDLMASLIAFPLLIWIGASCRPGMLLAKASSWLGAISYAVYVLHYPIYDLATKARPPQTIAWGIAYIVAVVVVSHIADRYFDGPVREYLNRAAPGRARVIERFGLER
jgi:peptidoglycan/LPS O-acetylase OafA/YrhL